MAAGVTISCCAGHSLRRAVIIGFLTAHGPVISVQCGLRATRRAAHGHKSEPSLTPVLIWCCLFVRQRWQAAYILVMV